MARQGALAFGAVHVPALFAPSNPWMSHRQLCRRQVVAPAGRNCIESRQKMSRISRSSSNPRVDAELPASRRVVQAFPKSMVET
ncbi:hypothetical protein [Pseudoxanthomonas mexicana]|uniref:hypothetical protein n=2 Tax=Pseudoxanthomonas TaxID=83618 RepID=UPI0012EDDD1E|nr:hypothetical protein [Pseudoxanthomonas mexicana]